MLIKRYIEESIKLKANIAADDELLSKIEQIASVAIRAFKNGNKLLSAGNGGSAADAQHFAAELVSKFNIVRAGLPAIALTTDSSILTAISNDLGYENIFAKQVEALGNSGDILFLISTSGASSNIVQAAKKAIEQDLIVVSLVGEDGSKLEKYSDYLITVPARETSLIQEAHIMIEHIICSLIEEQMFK